MSRNWTRAQRNLRRFERMMRRLGLARKTRRPALSTAGRWRDARACPDIGCHKCVGCAEGRMLDEAGR